jgi:hypothetical protein
MSCVSHPSLALHRIAMLSGHSCPLVPLGGRETGGMNVYQTSAEDHGRKAVGECQKIRPSLPLKCHGRKPVGIYYDGSGYLSHPAVIFL